MDKNWSIEAIQKRAANNWSLEGDNQLLNLMKSISKNIEQRCITSNNNLNRLMLDVDKTNVKLGNATTKLLDLNNTTFVEHTVMDIDSSLSNTEKCSTTENDKTFVPLPKAIEEAVTNGLNMMDRCYEKVLLDLDDSDEDENENGQKHVVCRQRDPYLNRHLPHLIGSKKWNDKWHIGLVESDEEVLSDEEVEEFSQSEDGDSISISPQTSNPPTASESDFAAPTPTVIQQNDMFRRLSNDVEENSPLFTPDYHAKLEKIKVLPSIVSPNQNEPKIETTNKSKPAVPSLEQPQQSIFVQQKTEKKFLNLFDDEPPLLEEPIRNERKPVNLFLDSDEEDDLLNNLNKKPTSIFNNNVANKPSLPFSIPQVDNAPVDSSKSKTKFLDDVDNNNVAVVSRSEVKPKPKSDFGGLFDDEPPDDFFDIIVRDKGGKVDNKKLDNPKPQSKTVNLFDSDDDDDDFSKIIGTSSKVGSSGPPVAPSVKENIVARSNTNESTSATKQIERTNIRHQETYSEYSSPFKNLQNTGPPKSYKSFLDDETPSFDEDKEESISNNKPAVPLPTTSEKNIFDDKPVVSIPPPASKKSLFDDEPIVSSPPSKSKKGLFDDEPPASLLPSTSKTGLFDENPVVAIPPLTSTSKKGLFDDEPPASPLPSTSKTGLFDENPIVAIPPLTSTSKKGLFDDEPPASIPPSTSKKDIFVHKPIVTIPPLTSKKGLFEDKPEVAVPPSKKLFFDEEPPPKDAIVPPVVSTRKSEAKIFYNDIPEALSTTRTLSDESESTMEENKVRKSVENHTLDETDQSLSFKKNLNMFSNPEVAKLPTIDKDKPKPNKLKTNFNINVAALLPGAKLPSQKQLVTAKQERNEELVQEKNENVGAGNEIFGVKNENLKGDTVPSGNISKITSTNVDDTSGLLTSLSKTRAKIQVQRKPSTRTGRQRLYTKSLLVENENGQSSETTDSRTSNTENITEQTADVAPSENISEHIADVVPPEDIPKHNSDVVPSEIAEPSPVEVITENSVSKTDVEDDWLNKATTFEEPPPLDIDEDEEDWLKTVDEKPSSPSKTSLYDTDDWLSTKVTNTDQKVTNQNVSHVMNYDWLTASSLPPEDINPPPTYSVDDYHEQDDWLTSYVTKEKPTTVDDLPNDEDDWLTSTKSQEQPPEAISSVTETKPEDDWLVTAISKSETNSKVKVVDEDDDWFTKSVAPPKAPSKEIRKTSVPEVLKQSPPKLDFGGESSKIFESKAPTKKPSLNSSIFDDDEDDDLFTPISKQKPVAKQTSSNKTEAVKSTKNFSIKATGKMKSLFSDDDESDPEDLFGSSKSRKTQKETKEQRPGEKVKANSIDKSIKKVPGGLFDDEDDDEDIFSSKTQKHHVNKSKKPSITKLVATIPASNDPLADLLK